MSGNPAGRGNLSSSLRGVHSGSKCNKHLGDGLVAAGIHFFEHELGVYDGLGGAALAFARGGTTHENMGLAAVTRTLRCYIFGLEEARASANEFMHTRPLLHATHSNCNACARVVALIALQGAGAVGQGRVQEAAHCSGIGCIKKGRQITNEEIQSDATVRPD